MSRSGKRDAENAIAAGDHRSLVAKEAEIEKQTKAPPEPANRARPKLLRNCDERWAFASGALGSAVLMGMFAVLSWAGLAMLKVGPRPAGAVLLVTGLVIAVAMGWCREAWVRVDRSCENVERPQK